MQAFFIERGCGHNTEIPRLFVPYSKIEQEIGELVNRVNLNRNSQLQDMWNNVETG